MGLVLFSHDIFLVIFSLVPSVIWEYFNAVLLPSYAAARNGVNVITGPIFDYDYNGVYDTPEEIRRLADICFSFCVCDCVLK